MKKLKSVFLFLFILSPLPVLCGCEPGTIVSESEIAAINNGQYDFKYGRVDIAHDTYLLINWNKERDTYYQVGPVVFKFPYDFKIIVKSRFTDASYYLREAYKDGRYNENKILYLALIHRQYMKSITGKTGIEFNAWYDNNNQRMENSHFSDIDFSNFSSDAYGSQCFVVTLKHEESIKFKTYQKDELFSNIEGCHFNGQSIGFSDSNNKILNGTKADYSNDYNMPYSDFDKNIPSDLRGKVIVHLDKYIDFDTAKRVYKQIKSSYIVYDATFKNYSNTWSIDI